MLYRGGDELAILVMLERLALEAAAAGGRVEQLMGNHEAMNYSDAADRQLPGVRWRYATRRCAGAAARRRGAQLARTQQLHTSRATSKREPPRSTSLWRRSTTPCERAGGRAKSYSSSATRCSCTQGFSQNMPSTQGASGR